MIDRVVIGKTGQRAFGDAIRKRLDDLGQSQRELGEDVGDAVGRNRPYGQATVAGWLTDSPPDPEVVFMIERCLGVKPGTYSRLLGYLPVEARATRTVLEAIDADPRLNDQGRRMLRSLYESAVNA